MNLTERINQIFDNFQDPACRAWDGYNPDLRPNWREKVEDELNLIREHSPVPLPEDYCEIFRHFGGGGIGDRRANHVMPTMTFWAWDDIKEFDATVDFFEDCPNALPFGDDMGDIVYIYVSNGEDSGIYMADKSDFFEEMQKLAGSLTELFTNPEAQRLFRNYYRFGCDKGGDGR